VPVAQVASAPFSLSEKEAKSRWKQLNSGHRIYWPLNMTSGNQPLVPRLLNDGIVTFQFPFRIVSTFLWLALATLSGSAEGAIAFRKAVPDQEIQRTLSAGLFGDRFFTADEVKTSVRKGTVTLSGKVDTLRARDRAIHIAGSIRGVRDVLDHLQVLPTPVGNRELRDRVRSAVRLDPAAGDYGLKITAENGVVTLLGSVVSQRERELAEWIAKGVHGVRDVKNNIAVTLNRQPSDRTIARDISNQLQGNSRLHPDKIKVQVRSGEARLQGSVNSVLARSQAGMAAAWVDGVRKVDVSGVTVEPQSPAGGVPPSRSDGELEADVRESLAEDPQIDERAKKAMTVKARKGVITLSGTVANVITKQAAEEAARNVPGISGVRNKIVVRNLDRVADHVIRSNFKTILELTGPDIADDIALSMERGHAILNGKVSSPFEKWLAWDAAARTKGIRSIDNRIRVDRSALALTDLEIARNVRRLIRADSSLPTATPGQKGSPQIEVSVHNGVASLTGKVTTWPQHLTATQNAFLGGAARVENRIQVESASSPFPAGTGAFFYSGYPAALDPYSRVPTG